MAKALMTKVVIMARGLGTGGVRVPCHFHPSELPAEGYRPKSFTNPDPKHPPV